MNTMLGRAGVAPIAVTAIAARSGGKSSQLGNVVIFIAARVARGGEARRNAVARVAGFTTGFDDDRTWQGASHRLAGENSRERKRKLAATSPGGVFRS